MQLKNYLILSVYSQLLISMLLVCVADAFCQSGSRDSFIEFPQTGVLAANGSLPSGSLALPQLPMGLDGRRVPFNGSLRLGEDKNWHYSVINNAADRRLKVVVDILQFNSEREQISSSGANFRIKPNDIAEGKTAVASKAQGCVIFLKQWSWEK